MALVKLLLAAIVATILGGCADALVVNGGMYGGKTQRLSAPWDESQVAIDGVRWYPRYVALSPTGSDLYVSLCHTSNIRVCRLGHYSVQTQAWSTLPYAPDVTYDFPVLSVDGKVLYYKVGPASAASNSQRTGIEARNLSTGTVRFLQEIDSYEMSISGSGKNLVYYCRPPTQLEYEVCRTNLGTSQSQQLTELRLISREGRPVSSLDDLRVIAYLYPRPNGTQDKSGTAIIETGSAPLTVSDFKTARIFPWSAPNAITADDRVLFTGWASSIASDGNQAAATFVLQTGFKLTVGYFVPVSDILTIGRKAATDIRPVRCRVDKCGDIALARLADTIAFTDSRLDGYFPLVPVPPRLLLLNSSDTTPKPLAWPSTRLPQSVAGMAGEP